MDYTIGTDPEFFLKRGKKLISAIPLIAGTKHEPAPLKNGGTVQRDNVAVEFATPPAKGGADFVAKVKSCLKDVMDILPGDTTMEVTPSASFPLSELKHPEAKMFGCDPDYDAWRVEQNEKPDCGNKSFRSCGAHVHVGGLGEDNMPIVGLEFLQTFDGKIQMVKAMDIMLGIPSAILDNSAAAIDRRKLYGKAGCHRPTDYGVEYRSLSNYWMKSPELVMLVYNLTGDAIRLVQSGGLEKMIEKISEDEIKRIINNGDVAAATKVVANYLRELMSPETQEMFDMCAEKLPKYSTLKKEWSLQ